MNMLSLVSTQNRIMPMSDEAINSVRKFEEVLEKLPQIDIGTSHIIHAGMYSRTVMIPVGAVITGALIKIATMLIVAGNATAYIGEKTIELTGYNVIPASANRKQAFLAHTDTFLTMIFPSDASTVAEAEEYFTDESNRLMSHGSDNQVTITGE